MSIYCLYPDTRHKRKRKKEADLTTECFFRAFVPAFVSAIGTTIDYPEYVAHYDCEILSAYGQAALYSPVSYQILWSNDNGPSSMISTLHSMFHCMFHSMFRSVFVLVLPLMQTYAFKTLNICSFAITMFVCYAINHML